MEQILKQNASWQGDLWGDEACLKAQALLLQSQPSLLLLCMLLHCCAMLYMIFAHSVSTLTSRLFQMADASTLASFL